MQTAERDRFIEQNLGLVHSCCRKFAGKGIEYEDLYGAGCVGLIKAVDGFDSERGLCFSTYAVPVILGEIRRLFRDGGQIKVSRALKELSLRAVRERDRISLVLGREATLAEISAALESTPEEVAEALSAARPAVSLTEQTEDGVCENDVAVPDGTERTDENIDLMAALGSMDDRDRRLIVLRYFNMKTQSETACSLGMTQVQVSRREKAILCKLRDKLSYSNDRS